MKYSINEVKQFVKEEDVKFIRLAFCDIYGKQKNISIMPGELDRAFNYGIAFDASAVDFINIDKAFFSCTAFSVEKGAMVPDLNLATTERCILDRAATVILLCDSSKFGEVSFIKVVGVNDIDVVITDSDLPKFHRDTMEAIEQLDFIVAP